MSSLETEKKLKVTNSVADKPCPKSKRKLQGQDESGPLTILVDRDGLLSMVKSVVDVALAVLDTAKGPVLKETSLAPKVSETGRRVPKYMSSYPPVPRHVSNSSWGKVPLAPLLKLSVAGDVITLEWDERSTPSMLRKYARVAGYELFGYRGETPTTDAWKKIQYFKAGRLPMKCKLVYRKGDVVHNYAVRAVDVHNRCAPCTVVKTPPSSQS